MEERTYGRFGALLDQRLCHLGIPRRSQQAKFMQMAGSQLSETITGRRVPAPYKILVYAAKCYVTDDLLKKWQEAAMLDRAGRMPTSFGHTLSMFIATQSLTSKKASDLIGISQAYMSRILKGDTPPKDEAIERVIVGLGMSEEAGQSLLDAARFDRLPSWEREALLEAA